MDGEHNHSIGIPMDRTLPRSKTDSDRLIKDNRAVTVNRPLKEQKKKKNGGAAGDRNQGLWIEPPALCH